MIFVFELALRFSGYGKTYPLFVPAQNVNDYLQPNPEVIKRFFHRSSLAPKVAPDTMLFKKQKEAGTRRIVLMGGSTAAGFPYGRFGSPIGLLSHQIKLAYPEEKIEFISVAMASINSYSILDFVDEVVAIEPDAVLIYSGHNEYLGVMGVGSNFASKGGHFANLAFLALKDLRIFQLVQDLYHSLFAKQAFEHNAQNRTIMASVAKEKSIPIDSPLFHAGRDQFTQNINLILKKFDTKGIQTFISTIASNEGEQAPFESSDKDSTQALLKRANELENITPQQAELLINADKNSANLAFMLASKLENNHPEQAREYYILASDLDELRFRAPSDFNKIIRSSSQNFQNVVLVDSLNAFRENSENKIITKRLMLEHLHPNEAGYMLIALSFFDALNEAAFFRSEQFTSQYISLYNNTVLESDLFIANHKIKMLTSDYPFVKSKQNFDEAYASNEIEKIALARIGNGSWITTQKQLIELYQSKQDWLNAGISAGILFEALPFEHQAARAASLFYLRANEFHLAYHFAQKAFELQPKDANYGLSLAEVMFRLGMKAKSIKLLDEIIEQHPNNQQAKSIRRQIS